MRQAISVITSPSCFTTKSMDDLSIWLALDHDVGEFGGLDLEGLKMRNRLLERLFGELATLPRIGDRWSSCAAEADADAESGVHVEDGRGQRGVLHFLASQPSALHGAKLLGLMQEYVRIDHPHLERVLDCGVLEGRPWIVRPIEATRPMREWLHDEVETWVDLVARFIGVGRAIAELHQRGLVHGELVPDAFVIDAGGRARVRGTLDTLAQRLAKRRADKASIALDQSDLCMAIHGALLAVETVLLVETPNWVVEVLERGFAERACDQWPSVTALTNHLEHRLRMRSRLVVLRGGAAA